MGVNCANCAWQRDFLRKFAVVLILYALLFYPVSQAVLLAAVELICVCLSVRLMVFADLAQSRTDIITATTRFLTFFVAFLASLTVIDQKSAASSSQVIQLLGILAVLFSHDIMISGPAFSLSLCSVRLQFSLSDAGT